jgi:hypothetical protein
MAAGGRPHKGDFQGRIPYIDGQDRHRFVRTIAQCVARLSSDASEIKLVFSTRRIGRPRIPRRVGTSRQPTPSQSSATIPRPASAGLPMP